MWGDRVRPRAAHPWQLGGFVEVCDWLELDDRDCGAPSWGAGPAAAAGAPPAAAAPASTTLSSSSLGSSYRAGGAPLKAASLAALEAAASWGGSQPWADSCASWLDSAAEAQEAAPLSAGYFEAALSLGAAAAAGARAAADPFETTLAVSAPLAGGGGGGGGGAEVWRGAFNSAPAAARLHAVEMAVLTSVQHPNIVAAYECLPDMALEMSDAGAAPAAAPVLRLRSLFPNEAPEGAMTCDVLIMEFCDQGTLKDALARGALLRAPGAAAAPPCGAVPAAAEEVLIDVAAALEFLHSMRLVHGNVRSDNILLRSDASRELGVQAKLGGFGRARILDHNGKEVAPAGAGGAPDAGGRPAAAPRRAAPSEDSSCSSAAAAAAAGGGGVAAALAEDVAAFGALILETLDACAATAAAAAAAAAGPPLAGPRSAWPQAYAALAAACLSPDPALRPPMAGVTAALERLAAAAAP
ncbi:MAG: kinase-like domain-containing protein [Monoraphidium minutum]|nr:MAG: kinase-like domain-containing protein [Monoraphidium minutum]